MNIWHHINSCFQAFTACQLFAFLCLWTSSQYFDEERFGVQAPVKVSYLKKKKRNIGRCSLGDRSKSCPSQTARFEFISPNLALTSPWYPPPTSFLNSVGLLHYPPYPVSPYRPDPCCPRWQGSPALTGWYRCQEPSGQMAGAKGEQTTRVHFFSHLLVGWAAHCGTNRIRPSPPALSLPHPLVPRDHRLGTSDSRVRPPLTIHTVTKLPKNQIWK